MRTIVSAALVLFVIGALPLGVKAQQTNKKNKQDDLRRADEAAYRLRLDIRALRKAEDPDRKAAIRKEINRRMDTLRSAVGTNDGPGMIQTVYDWIARLWGGGSNVPAELKKYRKTMQNKWNQYKEQYKMLSDFEGMSADTNKSLAKWALTLTEELEGTNIEDRRDLAKKGSYILEDRFGGGPKTRQKWEKAIYNGLTLLRQNSGLLTAVCGPISAASSAAETANDLSGSTK